MNYLYIYDCITGKTHMGENFPLSIGNTPGASICLGSLDAGMAGVLMFKDGQCQYFPKQNYILNGRPGSTSVCIGPDKGVLLSTLGGMFQIVYSSNPPAVQQGIFARHTPAAWYFYSAEQASWQGPLTVAQMQELAFRVPPTTWITMGGMLNGACTLAEFSKVAPRMLQLQSPTPVAAAANVTPVQVANTSQTLTPAQQEQTESAPTQPQEETSFEEEVDEDNGKYLCPACWLRFDAGDVMSIASHPDLMGDPVLGRHEMKRFYATQFNARGQALDEKGLPCMHLACPHCRRKLPPRFLESKTLIFSIIGAPSSGKSYYLASLVHEMAYKAAPEFGLAWRDADPVGNSLLNDVSNRLFSAATPQQAYLSKTDLEGALYEEFNRHGRTVKLPKPFMFNVSRMGKKNPPMSLVFYDNAGEHFEPGRNHEDSPGATHVAVASGLFFLFDPITSPGFRRIISNVEDPQLKVNYEVMDQQSIIMAETEARIASILNRGYGEQMETPFAVLIGKCDLWESYLQTPEGGGAPLLPVVENGCVNLKNLDANSDRLRSLLMKLQPAICSTAESISSNVRYFAVSQLGVSPTSFVDDEQGVTRIGPDPTRINPQYMCEPTLWMLNQIEPEYVDSV